MSTANPYPPDDDDYRSYLCEKAKETDDYWQLRFNSGTCFHTAKIPGVTPRAGSTLRFYPGTLGSAVRGLFIDGQRIFYHTPTEQQERQRQENEAYRAQKRAGFESKRATVDARFDALPEEFRMRIQRRRDHNPDFRWEYESYELFCCEEAVKIAAACREALAGQTFSAVPGGNLAGQTFSAIPDAVPDAVPDGNFSAVQGGEDAVRQWFTRFQALSADEQQKQVRLSDGHSGNTFGCACSLAYFYVVAPASVPERHGALAPLVGSKTYGDVPPEEVEA